MQDATTQMQTPLYIVVLIAESSSDKVPYVPVYEENVILVQAQTKEEAQEKAIQYANLPHKYKNENEETITWSLKQVVEARQIQGSLKDSADIYYRFFGNYQTSQQIDSQATQ